MEQLAVITDDGLCILKKTGYINFEYVLETITEVSNYKVVTFEHQVDLDELNIRLSNNVSKLYVNKTIKEVLSMLKFTKATKIRKHGEDYVRIPRLANGIIVDKENNKIIVDDKVYVIMTEDKRCIVRGRKNTKFVLATIDEECNYKLFTCRQSKVILENMNNTYSNSYVYLTDTVKQLYGVHSRYYKADCGVPKLIAVRAEAQYNIQL